MSEDQALSLTATLGAMTLVAASLVARRLPGRTIVRLALVWIAIFIGLIVLVGLFPRLTEYFT